MENYNNISSDTGQDKTERQPQGELHNINFDSGQDKTK